MRENNVGIDDFVTENTSSVERAIESILGFIGEDPMREGLRDTPSRVAKLYAELFSGIGQDPALFLNTVFDENHHEPVVVTDISFFSVCEHHLLPFTGYAHVGYMPTGKVVGASKLIRVVEVLSKRPQIQERLTSQIADTINDNLDTRAVFVFMSAEHMCMTMRGVRKQGSQIVTVAERGAKGELASLKDAISLASLKGCR
ncbi:MAG: GTP cyclohydrolase I FolE [SAR202 cluster bacterium Io17-Chloro-G3]|nr:MAG: GTP cyclohydrolase I FolE [SAR202 cluster bacterium Io17-Chloro-G3]